MAVHQSEFDVRCEWGEHGVRMLAPASDAVVVVDVLSFSTCVSIATSRGTEVFPYTFKDETAVDFARSVGATLARPRGEGGYSLSPESLLQISAGTKLVLPSPNGATLSRLTGATPTFAGCLRNAASVAEAAMRCGRVVSVVPAGERWEDGSMRPALEDLVGAGAIVARLAGRHSPEARAAVAVYRACAHQMLDTLSQCSSGRELIGRGFARDVVLAAELDVDGCAPVLRDGRYVASGTDGP